MLRGCKWKKDHRGSHNPLWCTLGRFGTQMRGTLATMVAYSSVSLVFLIVLALPYEGCYMIDECRRQGKSIYGWVFL